MEEYKKQVKINAVKAAKEKASYLLEAVGSKVGKPLQITEQSGQVRVHSFYMDASEIANNEFMQITPGHSKAVRGGGWKMLSDNLENENTINKTIKLLYEIEASFEILP